MITNELSAHGREKAGGSAFGPTWRRLLWWLWRHRHDRHGTWCRIRMRCRSPISYMYVPASYLRVGTYEPPSHRVSARHHIMASFFHHGIAAAVKGRWPAGIGHRIKSCVGACCVCFYSLRPAIQSGSTALRLEVYRIVSLVLG